MNQQVLTESDHARVRDFMSYPLRTVRVDERLGEAEAALADDGVSGLVVVGARGEPISVLSRTDLLAAGRLRPMGWGRGAVLELDRRALVGEAVRRGVHYVAPDDSLAAAAHAMVKHRIHRVVVMDGADYVGLLSVTDVMRALSLARVSTPIGDHMHAPIVSIESTASLRCAVERLTNAHLSGLVVLEDEWPVGLFSRAEALGSRELPGDTQVGDVMSASVFCMRRSTPIHHAAAECVALRARRLLVVENRELVGLMTGLDFARAAVAAHI